MLIYVRRNLRQRLTVVFVKIISLFDVFGAVDFTKEAAIIVNFEFDILTRSNIEAISSDFHILSRAITCFLPKKLDFANFLIMYDETGSESDISSIYFSLSHLFSLNSLA